ncbi:hypothetical protein TL16_g09496 [Triparma laevis f. inornata]|uniref:RWD domain-containing protein n=1 Tax=Triparma laevis f. inornata TaxID=1714386 RepID=A0A9W7B383_9STRA|nr:hypothetical protein TL16_g09496 [Triparma laevis f. inornata]
MTSIRDTAMEVLHSMYTTTELTMQESNPYAFTLTLPFKADSETVAVVLRFSLPDDYPANISISPSLSPLINGSNANIPNSIEDTLRSSITSFVAARLTGDADADVMIVYDVLQFVQGNDGGDDEGLSGVIDEIASAVSKHLEASTSSESNSNDNSSSNAASIVTMAAALSMSKTWHHSEALTSKGSVFVGSGTLIKSVDEVLPLMHSHSNQDTRHRKATHHMYAYRILQQSAERTIILHDNDDNGEDGAGRKLAILLENMIGSEVKGGGGLAFC